MSAMLPVFSHSSLSTFENCPRQFRYRYVDEVPVTGVGIEAHLGRAVHAALERLYRSRGAGELPDRATVLRWFEEAWNDRDAPLRIVRQGFEPADYAGLGRHVLDRYYARFHPFDQAETVDVELRVEARLDAQADVHIVGYVDRLDRVADGVWEIHDYKTSGSWPWIRGLDRDRQLTLYEIALRAARPEMRRVRHVWHYLTFDRRFVRERTPADLSRVRREVVAAVERIRREKNFPARPRMLCHWCDFSAICPEGQEHVARSAPPGLPGTTAG